MVYDLPTRDSSISCTCVGPFIGSSMFIFCLGHIVVVDSFSFCASLNWTWTFIFTSEGFCFMNFVVCLELHQAGTCILCSMGKFVPFSTCSPNTFFCKFFPLIKSKGLHLTFFLQYED